MSKYVVLKQAETNVTTYSSGPLSVGDSSELVIDFNITAMSGGTVTAPNPSSSSLKVQISRITPFDRLIPMSLIEVDYYYPAGSPVISTANPVGFDLLAGFGDNIQLDLVNPNNATVSFEISVVGK